MIFLSFNNLTASFNYQNICSWFKKIQAAHKIHNEESVSFPLGPGLRDMLHCYKQMQTPMDILTSLSQKIQTIHTAVNLLSFLSFFFSLTNRTLEIIPQELPQDTSFSLLNCVAMESSRAAPW